MAALVDRRDWEWLGELFAERLMLDYTSLWGGQPAMLESEELIAQWQAMLPGFDATAHVLTDLTVQVDGDGAHATASVQGTHLLDGEVWIATGHYDIALSRVDGQWRISSLTYLHDTEEGDRALSDRAKARAG